MKRLFLILVVGLLLVQNVLGQEEGLHPEAKHFKETSVMVNLLEEYHYRKTPLNDSLSSVIFDNYLEALDYNKLYFLAQDIDLFYPMRYQIDDALKNGNPRLAYAIFNIFRERQNNRIDYTLDLLNQEQDFDFSSEETFNSDRSESAWPKTLQEQDVLWDQLIKSQMLSHMIGGKTQKEAKDLLKKRYGIYKKNVEQYNNEDVYQIFMNAVTGTFDPHTNYFSPATSDNFQIEMSRSLEGIGAQLQSVNDYTVIANVIAGGPAFKSKKLGKDDRIIAVAQGADGEYVDVVGWRIDDVVKLIRGPKGSIVRLNILAAEEGATATAKEVVLIREKINLVDQLAKSEIIDLEANGRTYKVGVIDVPSFYLDWDEHQKGNPNYNSTSRDVKKLLKDLEAQHVDGVLIDLRRNGGGSLSEAIELTGLFIKDGPVVQIRNADGTIEVGKDEDKELVYDGPLAVLTSFASASASEIFAGAIQDYKRGIIIGDQTYGKGSVQNLVGLERFLPEYKDEVGQLKLTLAKYYRVTGNSVQSKGIVPDVQLPSAYEPQEFGESSEPSALPWDLIPSTTFTASNEVNAQLIDDLNTKYQARLSTDENLSELLVDIAELKEARKKTDISLNETERRTEQEAADAKRAKRNKLKGTTVDLEGEEVEEAEDLNDPYLKEGLNIVLDMLLAGNGNGQ